MKAERIGTCLPTNAEVSVGNLELALSSCSGNPTGRLRRCTSPSKLGEHYVAKVLNAAALTYVAGTVQSIVTLVFYALLANED